MITKASISLLTKNNIKIGAFSPVYGVLQGKDLNAHFLRYFFRYRPYSPSPGACPFS